MLGPLKKTIAILLPAERLGLLGLLAAMLIMAIIETAGVASILPFVALLTDPGQAERQPVLAWIYAAGAFESQQSFLIFFGIFVFAMLAFTNIFAIFTNYLQQRYLWGLHSNTSSRLLRNYLDQPYEYYLTRNTTILMKNVLSEVEVFIAGFVLPILQGFVKLITVVLMIALMAVVDWKMAVAIAIILGGTYAGIYLVIQKTLHSIGQQRINSHSLRHKLSGELFGSIKELRIHGVTHDQLRSYMAHTKIYSNLVVIQQVLSLVPKYILELLAFGGLIMTVIFFLKTGRDIVTIIPAISMFALAGYRVLPALQIVHSGLTALRFYNPTMDLLYDDLITPPAAAKSAAAPLSFADQVRLDGICYTYPTGDAPALHQINLSIPRGRMVAIVGATGSGKSTLLDVILGLLPPKSGRLSVDGIAIDQDSLPSWHALIGYVPQHAYFLDDTVARNIAFGQETGKIDGQALRRAARMAQIADVIETLPDGYDTIVAERGLRLSGGQRQRLSIARALYHDPAILVMDEPTSALDGATQDDFLAAIENIRDDKTVIVVSHSIKVALKADWIIVMDKGIVVESGPSAELYAVSDFLRRL